MKKPRKPKRWLKISSKHNKLRMHKKVTSKKPSSNTSKKNKLLTKKLKSLFKSILRLQSKKKLNSKSKWMNINSSKNNLKKIRMITNNKLQNPRNSLMITKLLLLNIKRKEKSLRKKFKKLGTTLKTLKSNMKDKSLLSMRRKISFIKRLLIQKQLFKK